MEIIQVEKFESMKIRHKIELKHWINFVDLAEKWFDEINNEWREDKERIVFFDGKCYLMISGEDLFFIKAHRKK